MCVIHRPKLSADVCERIWISADCKGESVVEKDQRRGSLVNQVLGNHPSPHTSLSGASQEEEVNLVCKDVNLKLTGHYQVETSPSTCIFSACE